MFYIIRMENYIRFNVISRLPLLPANYLEFLKFIDVVLQKEQYLPK